MGTVTTRPINENEINKLIQGLQNNAKPELQRLQKSITEQKEQQLETLNSLYQRQNEAIKKLAEARLEKAEAQQKIAAGQDKISLGQQKINEGQQKINEGQQKEAEADIKLKALIIKRFCSCFSPQSTLENDKIFERYLSNNPVVISKINGKSCLNLESAAVVKYLNDHKNTAQCDFSAFKIADKQSLENYFKSNKIGFKNLV